MNTPVILRAFEILKTDHSENHQAMFLPSMFTQTSISNKLAGPLQLKLLSENENAYFKQKKLDGWLADCKDGWMNRRIYEWKADWIDWRQDERKARWTHGSLSIWIARLLVVWMAWGMDEWMARWLVGWMTGVMDGLSGGWNDIWLHRSMDN